MSAPFPMQASDARRPFTIAKAAAIVAERHAGVDGLERVARDEADHHPPLEVALDGADRPVTRSGRSLKRRSASEGPRL